MRIATDHTSAAATLGSTVLGDAVDRVSTTSF
jgi:hypothetical protein